jgi:hypothetical protein
VSRDFAYFITLQTRASVIDKHVIHVPTKQLFSIEPSSGAIIEVGLGKDLRKAKKTSVSGARGGRRMEEDLYLQPYAMTQVKAE